MDLSQVPEKERQRMLKLIEEKQVQKCSLLIPFRLNNLYSSTPMSFHHASMIAWTILLASLWAPRKYLNKCLMNIVERLPEEMHVQDP